MNRNTIIGFGGLLFGFGLGLSQMAKQEVVLSFTQLQDFGLALVMLSAITITVIAFTLVPKWRKKSLMGFSFEKMQSHVTWKLFVGGALFGIGWGLAGICPGSAVASLGLGNFKVLWAFAGLLIGAFIHDKF